MEWYGDSGSAWYAFLLSFPFADGKTEPQRGNIAYQGHMVNKFQSLDRFWIPESACLTTMQCGLCHPARTSGVLDRTGLSLKELLWGLTCPSPSKRSVEVRPGHCWGQEMRSAWPCLIYRVTDRGNSITSAPSPNPHWTQTSCFWPGPETPMLGMEMETEPFIHLTDATVN